MWLRALQRWRPLESTPFPKPTLDSCSSGSQRWAALNLGQGLPVPSVPDPPISLSPYGMERRLCGPSKLFISPSTALPSPVDDGSFLPVRLTPASSQNFPGPCTLGGHSRRWALLSSRGSDCSTCPLSSSLQGWRASSSQRVKCLV